jgi:hypothetical protein
MKISVQLTHIWFYESFDRLFDANVSVNAAIGAKFCVNYAKICFVVSGL